ncbi:CCA tRNA nucleotidyltransferase [Bacillus taeanensis]|uniref:CCA-adding enzyme n=1 Tax=Bacillus taeanensis TaxID=273032 RepID=A0A366XYN5_9BACI|nr:CCA tRNA nucleotidyltransferase [Bacillus taeanensis]RBW70255.1 CCA tRNA nucleotidyltransferase [Bacillus taeanensis]
MNSVFVKAVPILETLQEYGFKAYFVGGAVRDMLLHRPIHDIDIATSASPQEVVGLFKNVIPVGIEHGTVVVHEKGVSYEVTTFRKETEYEDFRHPSSIEFVDDLGEDLQRRDFTINALAMTVDGDIIDLYNGIDDLTNRTIRAVGDPAERFYEDPLRMLRAVRFVSQLNFKLDEPTEQEIRRLASHLSHLSIERIAQEWEKLMLGSAREKGIELFISTGLYEYVPHFVTYKNGLLSLKELPIHQLYHVREMWALLTYLCQVPAKMILKAWKQPSLLIKEVEIIQQTLEHLKQNNWDDYQLFKTGVELAKSIEAVRSILYKENAAENIENIVKKYNALPIKDKKELSVNGHDVMKWKNKKAGPWLGKELQMIEQAVIDKKVKNEKNAIKEWVDRCNSQ